MCAINLKEQTGSPRLNMGKRVHLCEYEANSLAEGLNQLFECRVDIPRIRHGNRQTIDTLISEEALYCLRNI